jgi:pyrroloquinoline quinone biosynthesis protein E
MALLGDAAATDPACTKSPHHAMMAEIAAADSAGPVEGFAPRRYQREPA